MKKIIIKMLVAFLAINTLCVTPVKAEDDTDNNLPVNEIIVIETGNVNETVFFSLDDQGLLTIDGEGEIDKAVEEYCENYTTVTKVCLSSGISAISDTAFTILDETVIYEVNQDNPFLFINEDGQIEKIITETIQDLENEHDSKSIQEPNLNGDPNLLGDLNNSLSVPSDLTIKEDTSGNIVIHTNDATYLQKLVTKQSSESSPSTYLSIFFNNNTSAYWFYNSTSSYGDNIELEYNSAKGNVTLANSYIKSRNIINGNTLVRIDVEGYEYFEKTITLSHACKPAPTNVTISENANGDIVITSANTAWIKLVAQKGSVLICDDPDFGYDENVIRAYLYGDYGTPEGSFAITNSGKTLTITNEHLLSSGIPNGSYYIQISANGYGVYEYSESLEITKGAKTVDPSTISVECDQANGTIKIKSSSNANDEYMEKLASYSIYNYISNKLVTESEGGKIRLSDDDYSVFAWFENYRYKNNGTIDSEYKDLELSDDKKTLTLTKDAIQKYHVIKGLDYDVYIRVPGYADINMEISNITVGVEACPTVEIEEDTDGNIVISSDNLDYLRALVEENSDDVYDCGYIDLYTSLQNIPMSMRHVDTFGNHSYETALFLDESAKTVTIKNSEIIANCIINGSHDVELHAYGYSVKETNVTLSHACVLAPTGVTATVNTSGDLVITSSDTDWIEQFSEIGDVDFFSTTNDDMYHIEANPEYSFTVTNGGKTVTIRRNQLLESNIANGTYSLALIVPGYSRVSITKTIKLTKAYKPINAETVNVTYDDVNKAIIISSTNKDYLSNLCKVNKYYSYTNGTYSSEEGGYISFYNENNDGAYFENNIEYFDRKELYTRNDYSLSANKLSVIIPLESLYNQALVKGCVYDITLHAAGYQTISLSMPETLTFGASDQLPELISISFDNNGDMFIGAQDSEWLEGIMYDQAGAGRIEFYDTDDTCIGNFSNYYYKEPVITRVDNTKIKLAKEAIWLDYVITGDYYIRIYSHGYKTYSTNQTQEIKGLRQSPSPITAKLIDDKVILEYGDNDKTYLQDFLAATDSTPIVGGPKSYVAFIQEGDEDNGLYYTNQNGDNSIFYDETNKYAYVELSNDGKNYLKKHFNNVDDLKIELFAFGYKDYTIDDFEFKFIDEPGPIVLGSAKQLTFSDYDESKVTWESSDTNIVEINNDGLLIAKGVGSATITATYKENSAVVSSDNITVTVTSNSRVALKLKTVDGNTIANTGTTEQLQVTITGYTLTDKDVITFESDNEEVATVDENGLITFNSNDKAGTVTITATALNNRSASIKISVYNIDKSKKLTASYTGDTLETGEEIENAINVLASGEDLLCNAELEYSSSKDSIVSVDETGKLTANGKGTATITVALKDDPAKRKATCKVTVIDRVISSISDDLTVYDNTALVLDKCLEPENNNGVRYIHANYGLLNKNNKLRINVTDMGIGEDNTINPDKVTPAKVTYKSSNTSIATVDANGNITFKKAGKVTITVTVASNPKGHAVVSRDIEIETIDYTPRIEVNKFVLNKYYDYNTNGYPVYNLHKILRTESNLITNYKITDLKGNVSNDFEIEYSGDTGNIDTFSIGFAREPKDIAAKTYTQLLQFCVGDDNWYSYKVTIQVTATLPTVTPKVTGFYNTFTGENTLKLETTVKNGEIADDYGIEFVDSWVEDYDPDTKEIKSFTATSGKVRYRFDGYVNSDEYGYVEKTIKLPTKSTKPTVKLETSTYTLYVPTGTTGNKEIVVKLLDNSKNVIDKGTVTLNEGLSIANSSLDDNDFLNNGILKVSIPVEDLKSGKIVLDYQGEGWADSSSIPLTINIKTSSKLPTIKLSKNTVVMNQYYHRIDDSILIDLPGSSEELTGIEKVEGNDRINVDYENGKLKVDYTYYWDGESYVIGDNYDLPLGTYKIVCKPKTQNTNDPYPNFTINVKIENSCPKMKLKKSTVTLNTNYSESVPLEYSVSNNPYGATLGFVNHICSTATGLQIPDLVKVKTDINSKNVSIELLTDESTGDIIANPGNYKIFLEPEYENSYSGGACYGRNKEKLALIVNVISKSASASLTVKNAINPLDKNSSSPVTVKLTNLTDDITGIDIIGDYADYFEIDNNLALKIKDVDFSELKDGTYKVNALVKTKLITDGIETTLSIKLARKAPTVKLDTSTINVYDTTLPSGTKLGEVNLNFESGYSIASMDIPANNAYTIEKDAQSSKLIIKMKDGSQIKSNSSTSFSVKITWKNDFNNNGKYAKTTTVKFNVKDLSNSIKTVN